MAITIYDREGNAKAEACASDSSVQTLSLGGENVLSLSFVLHENIVLEVDDYADFGGERYRVCEQYRPKEKSTLEWEYDVKLYGAEGSAGRILVTKRVDGEDSPMFTLTAPPAEHVAMIVNCLNEGVAESEKWTAGEVEGDTNIVVDYFGKHCDEALKEIAEKAGTELWYAGRTINICKCAHGEAIAMGYDNGLTGIDPVRADNVDFYTRLYPIGSSRNIDREKYGHTRLQLPGGVKYVEMNSEKYGRVDRLEEEAFTGIYPRRIGTVSSVRSETRNDGSGEPFTIYYFKDDGLNFDPNSYEIGGLVKRVSFQEGSELAGLGEEEEGTYYFEVNYDSSTREFEIITTWPYGDGTQLPGGSLIPKTGDRYILWNIRMPDEYYALAEEEFAAAVEKYNRDHDMDLTVYKATTDHVWIEDEDVRLTIGQRVRLESGEYFPEKGYRESRITKITRKVNLPSQMDIEISDVVDRTAYEKITDSVSAVEKEYNRVSGEVSAINSFSAGLGNIIYPVNAAGKRVRWDSSDIDAVCSTKDFYSLRGIAAKWRVKGAGGSSGGSGSFDPAVLDGYAEKTWVQQQGYVTSATLAAYLTKAKADTLYQPLGDYAAANHSHSQYALASALSDYALTSSLTAHTADTAAHISATERTKWNKTSTDLAAILGTDSDTIINKWEEVVAFLDTYTEADTLAGLLGNKVDKVAGYGLSKNDFTDALLSKLNGIEAGANKYVHPSHTAYTVAAATGRVVSSVVVDALGHVTSVASKALTAADIPELAISKVTGLQDALDSKAKKKDFEDFVAKFDSMFRLVNTGTDAAPKYAIEALYGVYTYEFLTAKGRGGTPSQGGTFDPAVLDGYAEKTWVQQQGYVTSATLSAYLTKTKADTLYQPVGNYALASHTHSEYAAASHSHSQYALASSLTAHTADTTAHISATERAAWNNKVDKVAGKGLSENDFTDALLSKLNGIAAGANNYVLPKATADVLGGVRIGANISLDAATGKISTHAPYVHPSHTIRNIAAAAGLVLASVSVNAQGHVTDIASKTLGAADIPALAISKVTGLQGVLDAKAAKADLEVLRSLLYGMFTPYDGNTPLTWAQVVAGDSYDSLKANGGLWTESFMSAKGKGTLSGGGSGSFDSSVLDGYAQKTWVQGQGYITAPTLQSYLAKYLPYAPLNGGLSAVSSVTTWGVGTGTTVAEWDAGGSSIKLKKDCPAANKLSLLIDGTVYVNEGQDAVATQAWANGRYSLLGHTHSQYLTSHQALDYINSLDTRNSATTPSTYGASLRVNFKYNSVNGLNDGGTYNGELHFKSYGGTGDHSGGYPHQLGFTANGNIWHRIGTGATTWGAWHKLLDDTNYSSILGSVYQAKGNYVTTDTAQTISALKTLSAGLKVSGRVAGTGDDEGIVVGRASNNFAALTLGDPSGLRSVFYLLSDNDAVWRYSNGTSSYDVYHPKKAGTIALTTDLSSSLANYYTKTEADGRYFINGGYATSLDLNTITSSGAHYIGGAPNSPSGIAYGQLLTIHGGGDTISQMAFNYADSSDIAVRSGNPSVIGGSGSWKAWVKLLTSANYSSILDSRYYTETEINTKLSAYLTTSSAASTYAKLASPNNLVHAGNEITMIPSGFSGALWLNHKTTGGTNGAVSEYYMGDGAAGVAGVVAKGFVKMGSSDSYLLLGDGGHKAVSDFLLRSGGSMTNTNVVTNLNADLLDGYHVGDSIDRVAKLANFPSYSSFGYQGTATETYFSYLLKKLATDNSGEIMAVGRAQPNSQGVCVTHGYSSRKNGYPQWASGLYVSISGEVIPFYVLDGVYHYGNGSFSGNASSATKLQTARSIWGQSFDGSGNVSGDMTGVGNITPASANTADIGSTSLPFRYGVFKWLGSTTGENFNVGANYQNQMTFLVNGNVGIGTPTPAYKLDVNGAMRASGLMIAGANIQIGTTADIGWYINNSRICAGDSTARGVNVGNLLVSSAWADYTKVPVDGAYIKGVTKIGTDTASYALNASSFICDSWVRTTGATGWYNETYGGGWYMTDGTYIRNYNNRRLYLSGTGTNDLLHIKDGGITIDAYGGGVANSGAGRINLPIPSDSYQSSLIVAYRSTANDWMTENSPHRLFAMELHNTGALLDLCFGGARKFRMFSNGEFYATAGMYTPGFMTAKKTGGSSDERLKKNIRERRLSIDTILGAPCVGFDWRDGSGRGVGTLAQYWLRRLPEVVMTDPDGYYAVDYGALAHMEVSSLAKYLAPKVEKNEDEIKLLKKRVTILERENKELKRELRNR